MAGSRVTAGIVATGSELLAGRVRDANGPWIAERLGGLGVDVVEIVLVGDRPEEMDAALRSSPRGRPHRHQRWPRPDRGRPHRRGRRRPDRPPPRARRAHGEGGRRHHRPLRRPAALGRRRARRGRTASRRWCPRGATADPARRGRRPGSRSRPGDGGPRPCSSCPARRARCSAMWDDALASAPVQALLERTEPFLETHLRLFGVPESEIAATLRAVGEHTDLAPLEIVTCLRDFALEVDLRRRPGDEAAAAAHDAVVAEIDARHGSAVFSRTGETIDELLFGAALGAHHRHRRVVHRRPARGAAHRARRGRPPTCRAGSSPTPTRPRRTCSACRRTSSTPTARSPCPRSQAMARRGARPVRRRRRPSAISGVAGPGGGTEAEAGRLRLLLRAHRRRHARSRATRCCPASAATSASARWCWRCTWSGASSPAVAARGVRPVEAPEEADDLPERASRSPRRSAHGGRGLVGLGDDEVEDDRDDRTMISSSQARVHRVLPAVRLVPCGVHRP